ncbi:glucan 1,3-beta-glucosidase I/II [Trichomonascus vanleenenianus]|uniref:glycoside hydrolase family 5 protein n=1 Tax=Trichomonascus vanleenenianus TaxID=2268995 RepID=UPI003ECB52C1
MRFQFVSVAALAASVLATPILQLQRRCCESGESCCSNGNGAASATPIGSPAAASPIASESGASVSGGSGFDFNSEKVRGLNIGGWLVLEPYITPSLFTEINGNIPVDEYHLCQALGHDQAYDLLSQHWNSWIGESDFQQIAQWGFNTVRIPIGYWAFQQLSSDPYVSGQEAYLDKAIEWAQNCGLSVWVDLHGAPGSQNGFDNSGLRDTLQWQQGNNVEVTLQVLQYIANKYGDSKYDGVVAGIELLNEPLGPELDMDGVRQYYTNGYSEVRKASPGRNVVFHDAFQAVGAWNDFMQTSQGYWNVVLDHHQYQVFSQGELQRSIDEHISTACSIGQSYGQENLWRVTGEWSAALTDCTPWLNGVGRGARYEGQYDYCPWIGSCDNINNLSAWSSQKKQDTRRYVEAQMDAYDQGNGWIFWCYKTEGAVEWDVSLLIGAGLFPQPLDDRQYPNQCGYY